MNWKEFFITISGMFGAFVLYKSISLGILYTISNLQTQPYYQFIYFFIVILITIGLLLLSKKNWKESINLKMEWRNLRKQWSIFIIPLILFGIDFFALLPEVFNQSLYLIFVSLASALGAAVFEEVRDRGYGLKGMNKAIPDSKWKPLILTLITSFLFSITHYFNLLMPVAPSFEAVQQQVVYTFFLGACLAVLTLRTGTVFYAILFHFMNNFDTWTPTADLASASDWGSLLIVYGVIPVIYLLWCLRPAKSESHLSEI